MLNQHHLNKANELKQAWDTFKQERDAKLKGKKKDKSKIPHAVYEKLYSVLWKYGLETGQQVQDYYDRVCIEVLQEYLPVLGSCDLCQGYKGEPPCLLLFGEKSCFYRKREVLDVNTIHKSMLKNLRIVCRMLNLSSFNDALDSLGVWLAGDDKYEAPEINVYQQTFKLDLDFIKDSFTRAYKTGKLYQFCPQGHGYYHDFTKPLKDLPIEILWEI